jgi:hypothetical protein
MAIVTVSDTFCRPQQRGFAAATPGTHTKAEGRDVVYGPVFVDKKGAYMILPNLRRDSFLKILQRADVRTMRRHGLLPAVATLLLPSDVNVEELSERLGHESIDNTLTAFPARKKRQRRPHRRCLAIVPTLSHWREKRQARSSRKPGQKRTLRVYTSTEEQGTHNLI